MTNALLNLRSLFCEIKPTDPQRAGFCRFRQTKDFHKGVLNALQKHEPDDWVNLMFEYPHTSEDGQRIAYLHEVRSFKRDGSVVPIVTNTTKYLARHFSQLKDHEIRDLAGYTDGCIYKMLDDIHEIIYVIDTGPWSCMKSAHQYGWVSPSERQNYKLHGTKFNAKAHPYAAYCPSLGWRLAVRYDTEGDVAARALVFEGTFVRTYVENGSSSNKADPQLEAWLEKQGIEHSDGWENGTPLLHEDGMLFPYIDGYSQNLDEDFCISDYGRYTCSNVDGTADSYNTNPCGDCGDDMGVDDTYVEDAGYSVCDHCLNRNYTWIESSDEYIRDRYAISVEGTMCDERNLPDEVVELSNGGYAFYENCVCIDDEYYMENDYRVVPLAEEHNDESCALRDDCWRDVDGDWYHNDVEKVEIDGAFYRFEDCEEDEVTGEFYTPGTDMLVLSCGKSVHPDSEAAKQLEIEV